MKAYWGYQAEADGLIKPSIELPLVDDSRGKRKRKVAEGEFVIRPLNSTNLYDLFDNVKDLPYSQLLQRVLEDRQVQHLLVCSTDGKNFVIALKQ